MEQTSADLARTIHARRQLGEALEFGFALIDALGLSPLALDVIDGAIAALDENDAPDEDREPDAGYDLPEGDDERCASDQVDAEDDDSGEDGGDAEPSLGAPEPHEGLLDTIGGREMRFYSQVGWARGSDDDREDGDDNGIADLGGLLDQLASAAGLGAHLE